MIVYAPRALRDIDDILDWTAHQSPKGAHSLSIAIEHAIGVCEHSPRAGARTDEPNVYRWQISKYRITIFYRTLANDRDRSRACAAQRPSAEFDDNADWLKPQGLHFCAR